MWFGKPSVNAISPSYLDASNSTDDKKKSFQKTINSLADFIVVDNYKEICQVLVNKVGAITSKEEFQKWSTAFKS